MFTNTDLKKMIVPLFIEQFLVMLVGLADTFVISLAGEAAVSGVSLVNSFNTIFIFLFSALASGGAVVISQYIGKKDKENAENASYQLLAASVIFSIVISVIILIFHETLLSLLFGKVETEVMEACIIYLKITAYSYPALAIYNAGAALYRSIGKTSTTMYLSLWSNIINIAGNLIGVLVLHAGVAGVAWPSLIARVFSAVVITVLCFVHKYEVRYRVIKLNGEMLGRILRIAVPNGVESGIFQLVKVALSSVVALFGTYQIAANGIAQSIWSVAALVCLAMSPVFTTVIGQCMGASEIGQAEVYFKKLMKITLAFSVGWNLLVFIVTPLFMRFYAVTPETRRLTILLVLIHNVFNSVAFPFADPLGKGLRAAGDVKFTTVISLITSIGVRLIFSVIFGLWLNWGVIGIAFAMCLDWTVRGILFWLRFRSGRWKMFRVI